MSKLVEYETSDSDEVDEVSENTIKGVFSYSKVPEIGDNEINYSSAVREQVFLEPSSQLDKTAINIIQETAGRLSSSKIDGLTDKKENESEASEDFFGILDQHEDYEDDEPTDKKQTLVKKCNTFKPSKTAKHSEDNQDSTVPSSKFWTDSHMGNDWSNPTEVWGKGEETYSPKTQSSKEIHKPKGWDNYGYQSQTKRQRIEPYDTTHIPSPENTPVAKCPFYVHHKIMPILHSCKTSFCRLPQTKISELMPGHGGIINRIQWNVPQFSHLLCSASVDRTVKVWNVFSSLQNYCVQSLSFHEKAVKDVTWAPSGKEILSCSYDKTARLCDVNTGKEIFQCEHPDFVTCVQFHPVNRNWFVSGSLNALYAWDCRNTSNFFRKYVYKEPFGQVQAMAFLPEGNQFFTCNDQVTRDSADKNIMAWDFNKAVVLSNQIYQERFTCTRLRIHPHMKELVAQTQGDYIAKFSSIPPYKMNKCQRYESHKVSGYSIGCDYSTDGRFIVSGSADGLVYCYDSQHARLLKKLRVDKDSRVCLDVVWHPVLPSVLATADSYGTIGIFQ